MDIKPSSINNPQALLSSSGDPAAELAKLFPPGRVITGTIEAVTQKAQSAQTGTLFEVLINAEGKKVTAESNQAFAAGQQVKIEVTKEGNLRVLQILVPGTQKQQDLVQQGLRQALPLQQNHSLLLNQLAPMQALIAKLNQQGENRALQNIQRQINELLSSQPRQDQLQNPAQLKQAITNNGSYLEAKLERILQQLSTGLPNTNKAQTARSSAETPIAEILRQNAPLIKQLEGLVGKDLKAQLIKLAISLAPLIAKPSNSSTEAQLITRILQSAPAQSLSGTPTPGLSGSTKTSIDIPQLLVNPQTQQLLQQAGIQTPANQAAMPREAFDLAISTLLRQIASSIAKIQTNQFTSLAGQQAAADSPIINSWHVEIPVFSENQFRPIQLQIDEERTPDQPKDAKQGRQWKITLGFDFEELGEFFATLTIVENTVSTTFWSERPQTLERIRGELNILKKSLKAKGLEVTQLECRKGKPSLQQTRLDQQLVDIKT